jgi:protein phosphatase
VAAAPLMADRIALISDLHGNLQAFEAVLADIGSQGVSRIFNLGDLAGKGPDGAAVIDLSREVCEVTVQGNWDDKVGGTGRGKQHKWHLQAIGPERSAWLARLPGTFDFLLSGQPVRLFHASNRGIYHRVHRTDAPDRHLAMFENTPFTGDLLRPVIAAYGDVHEAFSLTLSGRTLINTGSVGNPLDVPLASYAVLEGAYSDERLAPWSVTIRRVPYDIEAAVRSGYASGMPDADEWASELRTARYRKLKPPA